MDIYYVESPGQIINAMESVFARCKEYKIIVRYNDSNYNDSQIDSIINFYIDEGFLDRAKIVFFKTAFSFVRLILPALINKRNSEFFVGCHKSKYTKILKALRLKLVLIDDGIATLVQLRSVKKCGIISLVLNYNYEFPLFTFLSFNEGKYSEHNKFLLLKSLYKKGTPAGVAFFGAKYVEIGLIEKKDYLNLLSLVLSYFKDESVIYIPHREESDENLNSYSRLGYSIKRLDSPSEIALVKNEISPRKVAGFYSASILTSVLIDNSLDAYSFRIPDDYIDCKVNKRLSYIYEYFERFVHVVDIAKI